MISHKENKLELNYLSKNGEEGYPRNLGAKVTYTIYRSNLEIAFQANTDKTTILSLINHSYFNLNGQGRSNILNHQLKINADNFTPVDETSIPFGYYNKVKNTPFDFRELCSIGSRINDANEQLQNGQGYDHNFVLNKYESAFTLSAESIGDIIGNRYGSLYDRTGCSIIYRQFYERRK